MLDKKQAHPNAVQLLDEAFYWDLNDPNGLFGAQEGRQALKAFRQWRSKHPDASLLTRLEEVLEKQGKMKLEHYSKALLKREKIQAQINNPKFNDFRFILQLDGVIMATCFAQLIHEGDIEAQALPILKIAIERLMRWNEYQPDFNVVCEQQIIQLYSMQKLLESFPLPKI